MDFTQLVFKRIDGSWIKTHDYIDWANELIEGGCNAQSTWELAACRWDAEIDPDQVERIFHLCLSELGLELPSDWYCALCAYSSSICQKMLQGRMTPWDCMGEMLTISDDHNEPYIHWIWLDLVDDLHQWKNKTDSILFNGALHLEDSDECIRTVAQQFIALCCMSLPEKFPWVWCCETCEAISEESTFTKTKTDTCTECGSASALKNMRFFEHRDAWLKIAQSSNQGRALR